uniref:RGS domain-containing protein n=1 Tax=Meloidogyne hapla TaxID=6305 RepID=A0A1I8AW15_MELHA
MEQRRFKWATSLEEVLSDFDALQLFQSWMGVDDDSSEHPLRLHFAIIAYRAMLSRNDTRVMQLAREIYNKFLRPKIGLCAFIDSTIRERVGQRLRQSTACPSDLFDECLPSLDAFLRRQHALFVSSHEFLDKFNSSLFLDDQAPSCSSDIHKSSLANRSSRKGQQHKDHIVPTLTADMLKRSQRDREAMVPAGTTRFAHLVYSND